MINEDFYPTPKNLAEKMIAKIKGHPTKILEPSAGKGDIIDVLTDHWDHRYHYQKYRLDNIYAIEIDPGLQATLRGKNINLLDFDFLSYSGSDKFDLIIGNPPFADGERHLLKAIDIMYRGQIVFLLNAETIRNPHTLVKQQLVKKLAELKADIEYIKGAFLVAERPTGVEAALIYINIERKVEDDLFADCTDNIHSEQQKIDATYEVSTKNAIEELVAEYNQIIRIGTETIINYYRNYRKVGKYLSLNEANDKHLHNPDCDLTGKMQETLNNLLANVRTDFWRRTLDLQEIRSRLTSKKQSEFETQLQKNCSMDFTENNIRQFAINFIGGYEKTLTEAVVDIFDKFTIRHCFSNGLYDENVHYFNGWKTNKAFKVNKKVIIPIYAGGYNSGPFTGWKGKWDLHYDSEKQLRDIDTVMNYFAGMSAYRSMSEALKEAFTRGESSKIKSTYFTMTVYKKGTIHLTFNSEDILRRFNITACRGKEFLPHDYGHRPYQECDQREQAVIDSFEGSEQYTKNLGKPLFAYQKDQLFIAA